MIYQKISGVLFDLDGTLLDTALDLARSLNTLRQRHKKPPLPINLIRQVTSFGCPAFIKLGFDINTDHQEYPQLCQDFIELYESDISKETLPFEGVKTVLESLNQRQLPWGIVTNKAENLARKVINELGLMENCACIIGGDTTPFCKPAPEPLLAACKLINLSPESCVFVGDSQLDIEAAHRANMPNVAALYGYIPENCQPETWGADYYIDKPVDLLDWLNNRL
jgi:2-phosphoglycolate phosphatase